MNRLALVLSFGVACSAVAGAQSWADPATWAHAPKPIEFHNVAYGLPADANYEPTMQVVDIYQNAAATSAKPAPVLVYMHGGAWLRGQRPASYGGFKAWLAAGFSVVNVEYRLDVPAPAAVTDVRCVLSFIKANGAKYNFDASRVVTYGTSAGGHLALLAAVLPAKNDVDLPRCGPQPKVVAVLDYYGPYHLEPGAQGVFASPSVKKWIGDNPQPSLEAMYRSLSPSTYLTKAMPPVFQAHGDADPTVPYEASVALKADLDRLGVKNVLDTVPGGGHGKWTLEENQKVALDSLRFLQSVGVIP